MAINAPAYRVMMRGGGDNELNAKETKLAMANIVTMP